MEVIGKEIVETLFDSALILNVLIYLPQIWRLIKVKHAKEISLLTFATFNVVQLIQALYAYLVNDIPYFIGMVALLITCGIVTILIIYYRIKSGTKTIKRTTT